MQCVSDRSWMLCRPVPGWHLLYSELQQSISAQGCGSAQAGCEDAGTLLLGKTLLPNATLAPGLDCPSISQLRESRSSCSQGEDAALLGSSGRQFRRSRMQFLEHHCSASRWHRALCCLLGTTAPRFQQLSPYLCLKEDQEDAFWKCHVIYFDCISRQGNHTGKGHTSALINRSLLSSLSPAALLQLWETPSDCSQFASLASAEPGVIPQTSYLEN